MSEQIEVSYSVPNLFVVALPTILSVGTWGPEDLCDIVLETGANGIQYHPTRLPLGKISQYPLNPEIKITGHQSFRTESFLHAVGALIGRHPLSLQSWSLLPERTASLDDLEKLQRHLGYKIPVILYPPRGSEESGTERPFGEKLFQPKPKVMERWGVGTVPDLITEAKRRGYDGFALDLTHMREDNNELPSPLHDWQGNLSDLLGFTQEIHVSAGRTDNSKDLSARGIDSIQELNDLIAGRGDTELMRLLSATQQSGWKGRVVVEIPASVLLGVVDRNVMNPINSIITAYGQIIGNVRDILEN